MNGTPTANAGADQTVDEGALVMLDGSASCDPDGEPLTYAWMQVSGPAVVLDLLDPARPTFVAPWVAAGGDVLTFSLTVSDGLDESEAAVVNVTVKNVNNPPSADAGPDQTVAEGSPVTLDATGSYDLDAEPLAFSWVQTAGLPVTLAGADTATPSFTAPLIAGGSETLTFEVTVDDGIDAATDTVTVVVENVNHAPVASAGLDQSVGEGDSVTLDGSGSSDPDSDPLIYSWTQIGGPGVVLDLTDPARPQFTAPAVASGSAALVFELVVGDGDLVSAPDTVTVTVFDVNAPPRCDLGAADKPLLWPPDHKMHEIRIVGVSDPESQAVTITILGVTQDEPTDSTGDGRTSPDAVIQGGSVLIRAERLATGNGRVYRIRFQARDADGATCTGSAAVCVPRNKQDAGCVDDGQVYDSTQ